MAIGPKNIYVPTLQGQTYVVSLSSHAVLKHFRSPVGDRIAVLAHHRLLLLGEDSLTAYALPTLKKVWQVSRGGNAIAVVGHDAYLSGNSSAVTSIVNLASGRVIGSVPVGHVEDSVYDPAHHSLWLANWNNGDMTIVNTLNHQVVKVVQRKEGGGFSPSNMMASPGGFMQLAVGPGGKHVYAASFSGNIMEYNAVANRFFKDIPVPVPMAKLSGIAIDPTGQYAYTTVESQKETVSVSLKTGRIVGTEAGLLSNRWFVVSR